MNYYNFADLLVRIKVAYKARMISVKVLKNKLTINFLFLLYKIGLIRSFHILEKEKNILIYLKYINNKPLIYSMDLVSKPSKRIYWSLTMLSKNYQRHSISHFYIISTSKGLITSNEAILQKNVSGEILCKIKL